MKYVTCLHQLLLSCPIFLLLLLFCAADLIAANSSLPHLSIDSGLVPGCMLDTKSRQTATEIETGSLVNDSTREGNSWLLHPHRGARLSRVRAASREEGNDLPHPLLPARRPSGLPHTDLTSSCDWQQEGIAIGRGTSRT